MSTENNQARAIELAAQVQKECMRVIEHVNQATAEGYDVLNPDRLADALEQPLHKLFLRSFKPLSFEEQAAGGTVSS